MGAREPPGLLDLVTTVSEVVQTRFYSEKTVRRWIETGKVRARQSGSTWLIEVPSLLQHSPPSPALRRPRRNSAPTPRARTPASGEKTEFSLHNRPPRAYSQGQG
ncbi:MAG: helix-turn-helix domain-containing protein [Anaerolineae bacterium]|nr:helix-turn-helix domain-containing protein [Anaerolineae bacterium]